MRRQQRLTVLSRIWVLVRAHKFYRPILLDGGVEGDSNFRVECDAEVLLVDELSVALIECLEAGGRKLKFRLFLD